MRLAGNLEEAIYPIPKYLLMFLPLQSDEHRTKLKLFLFFTQGVDMYEIWSEN